MEKEFGFPVVNAENIFKVIQELGIRPWQHAKSPMPLEEYVKGNLTEAQRADLRFAPQNEAVFLEEPSGKLYTGFRGRGKDWATVFTLFPGDLVPLVFEYKHGADKVTIVPPSGVPSKADREAQNPMAACAKREFEEEFGVALVRVEPLTNVGLPVTSRQRTDCFFPFLGIVKEPLEQRAPKLDSTEYLKGALMPLSEWMSFLRRGEFPDWCVMDDCAGTVTLLALLKLRLLTLY